MNLCWLSFHHSFLRKKSKKNDFIENLIQKIIQKFVMKLNNYSPAFLNSEFEWKTSKIIIIKRMFNKYFWCGITFYAIAIRFPKIISQLIALKDHFSDVNDFSGGAKSDKYFGFWILVQFLLLVRAMDYFQYFLLYYSFSYR